MDTWVAYANMIPYVEGVTDIKLVYVPKCRLIHLGRKKGSSN